MIVATAKRMMMPKWIQRMGASFVDQPLYKFKATTLTWINGARPVFMNRSKLSNLPNLATVIPQGRAPRAEILPGTPGWLA